MLNTRGKIGRLFIRSVFIPSSLPDYAEIKEKLMDWVALPRYSKAGCGGSPLLRIVQAKMGNEAWWGSICDAQTKMENFVDNKSSPTKNPSFRVFSAQLSAAKISKWNQAASVFSDYS